MLRADFLGENTRAAGELSSIISDGLGTRSNGRGKVKTRTLHKTEAGRTLSYFRALTTCVKWNGRLSAPPACTVLKLYSLKWWEWRSANKPAKNLGTDTLNILPTVP